MSADPSVIEQLSAITKVWRSQGLLSEDRRRQVLAAARGEGQVSPGSGVERTLTIAEAMSCLRVSRQTVFRWMKANKLRSVRIGRIVRIPESAINAILKGSTDE